MLGRSKSQRVTTLLASICGDCSAPSPTWASINRGILICSDCCSIHRALGRHISIVKSLQSNTWIPTQLSMVQSLYSCGANSVWEYSILDSLKSSGTRRKPGPSDPLHPVKSDFIRSKYLQLSFLYKPCSKEDSSNFSEAELSRQLHSSVRTPNLQTSLRLLSQGADANFLHPDKNTTPLMVAARAGQPSQVELLLVYGADPGAVDKTGRTTAIYASLAGHANLSFRLVQAQYEVSDRLTYYLCQRYPDHQNGQHFITADFAPPISDSTRQNLHLISDNILEELALDVYDEVDRREIEATWPVDGALKSAFIPFLPVNPALGSTRNQGRQKLARLKPHEFSFLIFDILNEISNRSQKADCLSSSEPIYDFVAEGDGIEEGGVDDGDYHDYSQVTDASNEIVSSQVSTRPTQLLDTFDANLRSQLASFDKRIQALETTNRKIMGEINQLNLGLKPQRHEQEFNSEVIPTFADYEFPSQEEVVKRTEAITRCIQELLISAKDDRFDTFIPCSERIVRAVTDMALLFPLRTSNESPIFVSLNALTDAATHFEGECRELINKSNKIEAGDGLHHETFVTQQIIQCAFDIAKSTKQLVAFFQ